MSEPHAAAEAHAEEHHDTPHVNYWGVFGALCVLTVLSVLADLLGGRQALIDALGRLNTKILVGLVVLAVACCKATFVMLYFMHLKFEGKWKYALLAPTMILALAIIAALTPDIGVHYYTLQTPQTAEAEAEAAHPQPAEHH